MQKIITIGNLPDEEVKLLEDFIEFLTARTARKENEKKARISPLRHGRWK